MRAVVIAALLVLLPILAQAVEPDEILADPALEARAREISKQLRCVVCQNQDIDSSNAGVARDLRLLVRERLTAGDSNVEVVDYVHARFGDFVLFKPPFTRRTAVLWLAPLVLVAAALLAGGLSIGRARRVRADAPLDPEDEARIAAAMDRYGQEGSE
ncbi:cytochrome c-type biogenesis protein [Mameliella sp. MMSF_3455]|uniref:cytochrome c-type biogenesis protein n=1 Tax=Mameliella sp. MMSF_3455 TaxID=3046714 RepID=UPI002740063A|nr:cytochrome c-type biogenesis protein [Mameliella sp. MMSF_3455]